MCLVVVFYVCEAQSVTRSSVDSFFCEMPLQLWVMENSMEVAARQLLLLYVSLSGPEGMGMQGGCGVFSQRSLNVSSQTYSTLYTGILYRLTEKCSSLDTYKLAQHARRLNTHVIFFHKKKKKKNSIQCAPVPFPQRKRRCFWSCSGTARSALKPTAS